MPGSRRNFPEVLAALERKPFDFDVVMLNRRSRNKAFIPCERLTPGHMAGRVRYSDYGNEGYVITREAARHFLAAIPRMMWEIDQILPRFWETGLNVFYVDPRVVFHDEKDDSPDRGGPKALPQETKNCGRLGLRALAPGNCRNGAKDSPAGSIPPPATRRTRRYPLAVVRVRCEVVKLPCAKFFFRRVTPMVQPPWPVSSQPWGRALFSGRTFCAF